MLGIATKIFGSVNDRKVRPYRATVQRINALEPVTEALSDDALRQRTKDFRQQVANGAKLDDILPEAFAVVREASKRALGLRQFDVQLIGGIVLHKGGIAEMRTGEGKTLVATAPVYLNALEGRGVHVITVNDYLASRDAEWMGPVYRFLGLNPDECDGGVGSTFQVDYVTTPTLPALIETLFPVAKARAKFVPIISIWEMRAGEHAPVEEMTAAPEHRLGETHA